MPRQAKLAVQALESRITPTGDLNVASVGISFPNGTVPGAKYTVSITLTNSSMDPVKGLDSLTVDMVDANTQVDVGTIKTVKVPVDVPPCANTPAMPPGKEKINAGGGTASKQFDLPVLDLANPKQYPPGIYRLKVTFGELSTETGAHSALSDVFDYEYQFGTLVVGKAKINEKMTIKGAAGNETFGMTGAGLGTFTPTTGGVSLAFTGTTAASAATETGAAAIPVTGISTDGPMKKLDLPTVSATGQVTTQGSLGELDLQSLGDGSTDTFLLVSAAPGNPLTLDVANSISHASVTANGGIAELEAGEWINPASASSTDTLQAPYITNIAIKSPAAGGISGDFVPDVTTSGTVPKQKYALGTALIGGQVSGVWRLGAVGTEIYANAAKDWYLESSGAVREVGIGGTYVNSNTSAPGLQAVSFGDVNFFGNVSMGGIEATGKAADGVAIGQIHVHNPHAANVSADNLPVTANSGTIEDIVADTWPSTAPISTQAIGSLHQTAADGSFQADLTLNAQGNALPLAVIDGVLGYTGPVAGGHTDWAVTGNIGMLLVDGGTKNWTLSQTGLLLVLKVLGDIDHSNISATTVGGIAAFGFIGSSINVDGELGILDVLNSPARLAQGPQFDGTNVTADEIGTAIIRNDNASAWSSYVVRAKSSIRSYERYIGSLLVDKLGQTKGTPGGQPTVEDTDGAYTLRLGGT